MKSKFSKLDLFSAQADAIAKVNEAIRPMGKKLWRVSERDALRLTRLLVWSERYNVSIEYIIESVLKILAKAVEYRSGKRSKAGLGISIPVLTGSVAKSILEERIAKDFPGNENSHSALEDRRNAMIEILDEDMTGKPRNPLDYSESDGFSKAYLASIKRKRNDREKLEDKIAAMPFRNNPFH